MQAIITDIRAAQNQPQLHQAGKLMRAHIEANPQDKKILLSEYMRKSMRMVNTKRLTTNY